MSSGRDKGLIGMSMNFEVNMAAPLDSRLLVRKKTDLTDPETFGRFWYKGMIVTVTDDIDDNNGSYRLSNSLPQLELSWVKSSASANSLVFILSIPYFISNTIERVGYICYPINLFCHFVYYAGKSCKQQVSLFFCQFKCYHHSPPIKLS